MDQSFTAVVMVFIGSMFLTLLQAERWQEEDERRKQNAAEYKSKLKQWVQNNNDLISELITLPTNSIEERTRVREQMRLNDETWNNYLRL